MAGAFVDLLDDLFTPLGGVSLRRMFGGIGVYKDGVMFGLVADDVLYLKADETTAAAFEAEGCGPFVYSARGRSMPMPYWRLPDRLYDEPDDFHAWAEMAFDVARRSVKPKAASKKRAAKPAGKPVGRPSKMAKSANKTASATTRKRPAVPAENPVQTRPRARKKPAAKRR